MSKAVGIVLTVAAVAFAIAVPVLGPGAFVPLLGSTAAAAAGTAAAISAALGAAIMVNNLLMPKGIGNLKDRQAMQVTLQLGEVPRMPLVGDSHIRSPE